ncbi:MAG: hypothetical protein A2168_02520 [Planctomycetes bacterium RBG_13_50_24]|nr:MAG: hypothetical protein A2168_02520 [Planctomycetes bacterium RBG_13_50_24]
MKKWIVIVVILICCGLYAMIKFSMSQNENVSGQAQETQNTKQKETDKTDTATSEKSTVSTVPAVQVEAVAEALREFQNCLKEKKYEQAWELTTEYFKQRVSEGNFEKFKENMAGEGAGIATATVHPESATVIEGRVGLLISSPSLEYKIYLCFIEDNGKWKLDIGRPAHSVNASKE